MMGKMLLARIVRITALLALEVLQIVYRALQEEMGPVVHVQLGPLMMGRMLLVRTAHTAVHLVPEPLQIAQTAQLVDQGLHVIVWLVRMMTG